MRRPRKTLRSPSNTPPAPPGRPFTACSSVALRRPRLSGPVRSEGRVGGVQGVSGSRALGRTDVDHKATRMKDHLSGEDRSAHMRLIRGKNTLPELRVRQLLHAMGYRFRLHRRDLPGSPDIVLPRFRLAIFVHGCFWHQHDGCRLARLPKSRLEYWLPKFRRIAIRDEQAVQALASRGWETATIWECETTKEPALRARLSKLLAYAASSPR